MNIVFAPSEFNPGTNGVSLAIGVFDGVHLGHQTVIGQACESARQTGAASAVVTFGCHPNAVVAPGHVPPLIYPLSKKLRVIASLGVDTTLVIHFDKAFSEITGEEFIRGLHRQAGALRAICVGETFQFGHRRSGNVALLRKLGGELGIEVHALPDVSLDGQPVSSTRIREAIRAGQFEVASRLLGRPYSLCGKVIFGAGFGKKLGFPTANLDIEGTLTPPAGVYSAEALAGGETYKAAVNVGHRPTVQSGGAGLSVEAHLLNFSGGGLYGQEIELTFLKKLRDERKFPSVDALREQIARDVAAVAAS